MSGIWKSDKYAPIKAAVLRGFETGEYYDLVLECQDYQFQVHKIVVCLQSAWLAKAVKEKKKPANAIQLPEENLHVASAMLRYLYAATYSYPKNVEHTFTVPIPAEMLFQLQLYALANTLLVDPLKALAQKRFQEVVERDWNTDVFPDTIKRVYEITTPETDGGQLRDIVVRIAAEHGKELMAQGGRFSMMMAEVAEFGRDVFQVMTREAVVVPFVAEKIITYNCPVCPFEFYAKAIEREAIACSSCSVVNKESEWRTRKKTEADEAMQNETPEVNGNGVEYVNGNGVEHVNGNGVEHVNGNGVEHVNGNGVEHVNGNGVEHTNGVRIAEVRSVEKDEGGQSSVKEFKPVNGTNGTEEKIEWSIMKANGECVKESGANVGTHEAEEQEIVIQAKQNGIGAKQNGIDSEQNASLKKNDEVDDRKSGTEVKDNGVDTAINGVPLQADVVEAVIEANGKGKEAKANMINGNGNNAQAKTDLIDRNGNGAEARENGGEVKETPVVSKKKAKKARKVLNAANTLASSPTSPRATEAQIIGIVNGR